MNAIDQFVLDYFQLGDKGWIKKYSGNIPDNIDEDIFSEIIKNKGLEKKVYRYRKMGG